ncbi:ParB/RepB/Spo0J family partition protein [Litorimonas haliclonae]|uniref:ParB/RepB/Spo0J family partition protein n=1 Tax=Litorimonas haliclonae TaxID=2081977 RepID=UPI0039EF605E
MTIFRIPTTQLIRPFKIKDRVQRLYGSKEIKTLADEIFEYGLLKPLRVIRTGSKYKVLDGNKRLLAIHRLIKLNQLPRSLETLPCVLQNEPPTGEDPILLSEYDLYELIMKAHSKGLDIASLSDQFECSETIIRQALSLENLNQKIKQLFSKGMLSLAQVSAFSTLPNKVSQWRLLQEIGPFAGYADIISAISSGESVVNLPNGDILILPSRSPQSEEIKWKQVSIFQAA